jgi:hypothetical protein
MEKNATGQTRSPNARIRSLKALSAKTPEGSPNACRRLQNHFEIEV